MHAVQHDVHAEADQRPVQAHLLQRRFLPVRERVRPIHALNGELFIPW